MSLAGLDLNLLRVLDALLVHGSTVRAAEALHMSQPAVSSALGRLRYALGDPLFVRRGQGLAPTPHAEALAAPLAEALERIEALTAPPAFEPARSEAVFRLAGADFWAEMLMPALGDRLSREAPGVRVQLLDLVPTDYVGTLEAAGVDVAFLPKMEMPPWAVWADLFASPFVLIARKGHARLGGVPEGGVVPIDLFCDLSHVLMSAEGKLTAMTDDALAAQGRTRRVAMTMPFFSGVIRAVAASDRVAMIPVQLAEAVAAREGLALYAPPLPPPAPMIGMAWHRRTDAAPGHVWLRALVAEMMAPLRPEGPRDPSTGT